MTTINNIIQNYLENISLILNSDSYKKQIKYLIKEIEKTKKNKRKIFICGNGGNGGNANHIENDLSFFTK
tara:strand:- start:527 stop:736 length:210 start_codon:yes stop_codon:yes gene_type:complete